MTHLPEGAHVVLLGTGGTISSRSDQTHGRAAVASDDAADLLKGSRPRHVPVRVIDVFKKNSFALRFEDMVLVCRRIKDVLRDPTVLGVVVTHGTDTMEETAYLTNLIHQDSRPVIFTGAQMPADADHPDGPANLSQAIALASDPSAIGRGVLICFADTILPARGVRKTETKRRLAFGNPDFGLVGSATSDGSFLFTAEPPQRDPLPLPPDDNVSRCRVDLVAAYPGADAVLLQAALRAGAKGIVLQGTGSGNANPLLTEAVKDAIAAGVVVVTSTRVHAGPVMPLYGGGGGADLLAAGAIPSGLLRPSQALILLSLLLCLKKTPAEISDCFVAQGGLP